MKLLNVFLALGLAVGYMQVFAQENPLAFHLECASADSDCIEMPHAEEMGALKVKKDPAMTIAPKDVAVTRFSEGEYGQERLDITLEKDASLKLEELTSTNDGKVLAIVFEDKILSAPTIQGAIQGGNMSLSFGRTGKAGALGRVTWLNKLASDTKVSEERRKMISMIAYLVVGALMIGGAVYFAFFRKRASA